MAPKDWVIKAKKMLERDELGSAWTELVGEWYRREEGKGFVSPVRVKGLSARQRPSQVGAWVQRARNGTPEIKDVEVFAKEWARWWEDINPAWRKLSLPMEKKDGDWAFMDVPGPNGFLNVLVCLLWWRQKLEEESQGWRDAVEDVMWVLRKMNEYVTPFCYRAYITYSQ
ncbi:hypothetical protein B0H13DRAFT_1591667 [Mycena leptocephala]|nr:hypothetical protein B0H13DRAFT_1658785 [Mycena leptocephala]KAJ7934381.1 hypothetical protein B0H13DRAFT_1591667 [Mycena leptocephala]